MSVDQAQQAFSRGDLATARRLCDELLVLNRNDAGAHRVKGMALVACGSVDVAIEHFRRALAVQPKDFLALDWLHGALMQAGRFPEAVEAGERAHALRPDDMRLLLSLSQGCFRLGDHTRAIRYLESAKRISPQNPTVCHLLGQGYEKAKRNRDALAQYREAIRLNPLLSDAYDRANRILLEDGKFAAAFRLCEQAFARLPDYGQARLQAAQALNRMGRTEEAILNAKRSVALDPSLAANAATWFQSCGLANDALETLETSVRQRPVQGRAYYGLVKSRTITEKDRSLVGHMESILDHPELPPKERFTLLRALGKAADNLGEYESAMRRFDESAAIGVTAFGAENAFDPHKLNVARESFLRIFDQSFFARHRHFGRTGSSPIFVIGMIRSGTTLVQQILASHPSVGDAGEQPFWTTEFPHLADLDAGALRTDAFLEARDRYLEVLKRFSPDSPVIANKWPMNYAHAGLLLLAYPDAKIVHVARYPVDTALSIYMTDLGEPPPEFVHRKEHIVAVYRDYRRRMEHWSQVLPAGSVLTVRYEDLVSDQQRWTRELIAFCGLKWDDRCLSFYAGDRTVNTPSMLQVRKPIYASSVGKWRNYEPWLGQFAELIETDNRSIGQNPDEWPL